MTPSIRRLVATCLLASLASAGGCASWSTFPPTAGGDSIAPGLYPAPQVMSTALAYCHQRTDPSAPLVFNLPAGVSEGSWERIGLLLGADARPMTTDDRNVWSIEQVRIRGNAAEVDVVHLDRGVYQLATVHLEKPSLTPWRADYLQRWWIPVATPVANDPRLIVSPVEPATPEANDPSDPSDTSDTSDPSDPSDTSDSSDSSDQSDGTDA